MRNKANGGSRGRRLGIADCGLRIDGQEQAGELCKQSQMGRPGVVCRGPARASNVAQPPSAGTTAEGGHAPCVTMNGTDSAKQSQPRAGGPSIAKCGMGKNVTKSCETKPTRPAGPMPGTARPGRRLRSATERRPHPMIPRGGFSLNPLLWPHRLLRVDAL